VARSEARLLTEIWEDRDFLALTDSAQRLFMFLISQPDLAHSGVIALRERRWSRKSSDGNLAGIEKALTDLAAARFLVVDWDSEEILIRSLIRRDRIFKQPNVMRAAVDNVPLIESQLILRALCVEMERIRQDNTDLTTNQSDVLADMEKALAARVQPDPEPIHEKAAQNPSPNPSRNPSADPSPATPGVRGEVTNSATNSPNPGAAPVPPPAGDAAAPAAPSRALAVVRSEPATVDPRNTHELVAYWLERCDKRPPGQVIGHLSKVIKTLIEDDRIAPHYVRAGIDNWMTKDVSPSVLPGLVNTAMNQRAPAPKQSTRDQRVQGWMELEFPGQEAFA
jgi:hypothetical protein